jgi:hypothetical protein
MTEGQLEQRTQDWPCMPGFGPDISTDGINDDIHLMTGT